ncbi:SDR family oxidoreductase [Bdellovibrio sp. HCB337]|uniref:SDR family oxidoreductase n=1 Tax=Bdellovibrio sp. HCB337 TaxID=3394358 RepID=UPI0039A7149F
MAKILLTGATGYIGHKLLSRLLSQRAETILVPVRATSAEELGKRTQSLLEGIPADKHARVQVLQSDLDALPKALEPHRSEISIIIHNAAKTAFNVDETTANSVNRDASLALLKFASECPKLENFTYVSTLYASGMTAGPIREEFFPNPTFANHYERSKWEVEEALRTQYSKLPWRIARVATVIADGTSGTVIQQNAIHNTLKLFYYGLISLLPGKAETPIHLVDGDFTAESLAAVVSRGEAQKIYHVCYDQAGSIMLGRFIDIAFDEFNKDETFKTRRLLKPLFADEKSFDTLVTNMKGFGGSVLNQGLASISPFGRQLFVKKEVDNSSLQALLPGYKTPATEEIVRNTCQYLAQTKFAKYQGSAL